MTFDLAPRPPKRPLFWSDAVLNLQEFFGDHATPAYIVGGAVRDAYLHRPIKDIDLATPGSAVRLAKQLANALKGDLFIMDAERDVARVLLSTPDNNLIIDIAAFRGVDLLADLRDRDFTLNAMAVDLNGDLSWLIDPLGGEADIAVRRLRRCSPKSIAKDAIRALRAIRQSTELGFRIDEETLRDIRAYADQIVQTSAERIRDEFFKLLALPKPSAALRIADRLGVLPVIIREVTTLYESHTEGNLWEHTLSVIDKLNTMLSAISFKRTDNTASNFEMAIFVMQLDRYRVELNQHIDTLWANDHAHRTLLMFAALLHNMGRTNPLLAEGYADALRLSNAEKQRLVQTLRNYQHPAFTDKVTPLIAHRFWHTLGAAGVDACFLMMAHHLGTKGSFIDQDEWLLIVERVSMLLQAYYQHYDEIVAPPSVVDGTQLLQALSLKPGPIIGELLTLIREAQVTKEIVTADDALHLARTYLKG